MKYSFLFPYYKRSEQLSNTLKSFQKLYGARHDWEVVIVEDIKSNRVPGEQKKLEDVINYFSGGIAIRHTMSDIESWNPAPHYNKAAKVAEGKFFIITSPECLHLTDILHGLDTEFWLDPNRYVVCACRDDHIREGWRHHSVHKPRDFHFCTAISRENYEKIGGFDEAYANGISYDDNDFLCKILAAKIPLTRRDDLLSLHQYHDKDYYRLKEKKTLWAKNQAYFKHKWGEFGMKNTVVG